MNDNANDAIESVEENFQHNRTPRRMFGVVSVEETNEEKVNLLMFTQIVHQCYDQMSLKMGIKMGRESHKELKKNRDNCP